MSLKCHKIVEKAKKLEKNGKGNQQPAKPTVSLTYSRHPLSISKWTAFQKVASLIIK
jgi:hypothetical protein